MLKSKRVLLVVFAIIITVLPSISSKESLALSEDLGNVIVNPSSLYFQKTKGFYVSQYIQEDYSNVILGPLSYLQKPESNFNILFTGSNMSLGFKVNTNLQRLNKNSYYNIYSQIDLKLGFTLGFLNHFALSIFVNGGQERIFSNVKFRTGLALYDSLSHIVNYNDPYNNETNDNFFGGVSLSLDYSFFSLTVISNQMLSLKKDDSQKYLITFSNVYKSLSAGFSFKTSHYLSNDDLAPVRALFNFDFYNIGSDEKREVNISSQLNVQLSEQYCVYLKVCYLELKPSFKNFFKFEKKNALVDLKLGGKIKEWNVYLYSSIPFDKKYRELNVGLGFSYSPN